MLVGYACQELEQDKEEEGHEEVEKGKERKK